MKRILITILLAVFAATGFATRPVVAEQDQGKQKTASKATRWSGAIQQMDKDNLTLTVRHRDGRTRIIHYTTTTKWANKAGATVESTALKEGDRVVCLGKFEGDKFVASEVILQQ